MAEPGRLMGQPPTNIGADDPDADGEYDEDEDEYAQIAQPTPREEPMPDAEGSDMDAEGEEDEEDDYGEPVGAVKVAAPEDTLSEDDNSDEDEDVMTPPSSDAKTSDSEQSASESEAENEWQGESEDEEEAAAERETSNACTFCGQDEENDPSEEFEEYLTCAGCGDNAHRQCARDANTLSSDDDARNWHCLACLQNALNSEREPSETPSRPRQSSVPKLARDLLPANRRVDPGGHSVFNDLILPDDPLDGSRSLRNKRKSPHEDDTLSLRQTRKKRRSSEVSRATSMRSHTRTAAMTDNDTEHGDDGHPSASEHGSTRLRSAASRTRQSRPKRAGGRPLCWVEDGAGLSSLSLVVVFHLDNKKVQEIVSRKPKKKLVDPKVEARRERDRERRERNRRAAQQARAQSVEVSHYPAILPHQAASFYAFQDKDHDETKNKPYGGILSETDADTSKTYPTAADRKRFEDARLKAEEDWKQKQAALSTSHEVTARQPKQAVAASKIKCINFGGWEIDTWHAAPYPEEYSKNKVLYICEFCLKYMNSDYVAWRHKLKCPAKHPPGDEIYRDGNRSFFEVDGRKNPVYCQNLCLLAKLFLGSKTLYYDVEPFLFYVMTENDAYGCHFVGYFSKEKRPSSLNNVSCILVLPIHMRKGYGQYLIEFSYLLTRVENKTGSPEKPLSDMGLVSYRKYWRLVLCQELLNQKGPLSISAISERTGMTPDDIVSALEGLRALVRDPVTKSYAFRLDYSYFKQYVEKCNTNNNPKIKEECLIWTPYVMGRLGQYEDGPGISTVQQREEVNEVEKLEPEEGVQQMDFATAKNGTTDDNATSLENGGESNALAPPTEELTNGCSPTPGTPIVNGSIGSQLSNADLPIPPNRYEVFPPIPGLPTAKRRPGRPFGSRRRTGTPSRNRSTSFAIATAPVSRVQLSPSKDGVGKPSSSRNEPLTPGPMLLRRTRSKLAQSFQNGASGDETNGGGEVRPILRRGRTRSSTSSLAELHHQRGKANGKGKAGPNGLGNDVDAEGESDDDAPGEMDIDAEGESDDPADVEMANA